jgi:hypothetical protein
VNGATVRRYALVLMALLAIVLGGWAAWYWSDGQVLKRKQQEVAGCLAQTYDSARLRLCLIAEGWDSTEALIESAQALRDSTLYR